jgi:hypothetical protein
MKQRSIFKFIAFLILFLGLRNTGIAQKTEWQPLLREVVVNYTDSIVRANILLQKVDIATSNDLMYYWYNQNKISNNMGGYAGSLLQGSYLVYDNNKNLITEGEFDRGLMNGTWRYWNSKGILKKSAEFKKGQLHGNFMIYDTNGNLLESFKYKSGKLQIDDSTKEKRIFRFGCKSKRVETPTENSDQ